MELILLVVILLQFGYLVYSDIQNRRERKFLQMNLNDFTDFDDIPEDSPKEEEDPFISIEEAGVDKIVEAKDN